MRGSSKHRWPRGLLGSRCAPERDAQMDTSRDDLVQPPATFSRQGFVFVRRENTTAPEAGAPIASSVLEQLQELVSSSC